MNSTHVMFDLETLATSYNAVIISIGAVKFTLGKGVIDEFYINIDAVDGKRKGCFIDPETVNWWKSQPTEARKAWQINPQPLQESLQAFVDWYGKGHPIWAKGGTTFDFPIIEHALNVCGIKTPWKYWQCNAYRTLCNVVKIDDRKLKTAGTTYHNALDDCKEQTKVLIPILKAFEEWEAF